MPFSQQASVLLPLVTRALERRNSTTLVCGEKHEAFFLGLTTILVDLVNRWQIHASKFTWIHPTLLLRFFVSHLLRGTGNGLNVKVSGASGDSVFTNRVHMTDPVR